MGYVSVLFIRYIFMCIMFLHFLCYLRFGWFVEKQNRVTTEQQVPYTPDDGQLHRNMYSVV
jgi:hypothetical protein